MTSAELANKMVNSVTPQQISNYLRGDKRFIRLDKTRTKREGASRTGELIVWYVADENME